MKIFEIIYGLTSGGAEKFVVNLSNELTRFGHEVVVCTTLDENIEGMSFNKKFLQPTVKTINLGYPKGFNPKIASELERIVNEENPDVIHCHLNIIPYLYKILKSNKYPIFQTIHNLAPNTYSGGFVMKYVLQQLYKRKKIIPITISDICRTSFISHFKEKEITLIENGVPHVKASSNYNQTMNYINSIKGNDRIFIHVGRFSYQKNQELLIRSFNKLNERGYRFQLLILGAGFESSDGIVLQKKACSRIHFLGEVENVGDYLLCSDAFCLTSIYEGLPLSLIEAMSTGCIPICTPVGGIVDVVGKKYGYLSKDVTEKAYLKALTDYFDNNIVRKDIVKKRFQDRYSIEKCAREYEKIFQIYN